MKQTMWVLGLAVLISAAFFAPVVRAEDVKKAPKTLAECVAECNELDAVARRVCIEACE